MTTRSDLDARSLVLVTCSDCNGAGFKDNSDGTVSCSVCGGYGECWVDEEDAPSELRVHKETR